MAINRLNEEIDAVSQQAAPSVNPEVGGLRSTLNKKFLAFVAALSTIGCDPSSQAKSGNVADTYSSADDVSADAESVDEGPTFGNPSILADPKKVVVFGNAPVATSMNIAVLTANGDVLFENVFPVNAGFYNVKQQFETPVPYGSTVEITDPNGKGPAVKVEPVGEMPDFPEKK